MEANGDLLRRVTLTNAETYDYNRVYELVPKALTSKPIVRCKARCTSDAIKLKKASTFGAQPPRKVYLYKDIERFYSFANNPGILILGCMDPERRTRSYEFFKFEDRNVQEIGDIINRARKHPMCILMDDEGSMDRYQSSKSSLTGEPEAVHELAEARGEEEMRHPIESPSTMVNDQVTGDQNEVASVGHTPKDLERSSPIHATEPQEEDTGQEDSHSTEHFVSHDDTTHNPIPVHLLSDPLFRTLCEHIKEEDVWAVDFKYVGNHPKYGSQIDRRGGTYLFVAHHKYPEHVSDENPLSLDQGFENRAETAFTVSYLER